MNAVTNDFTIVLARVMMQAKRDAILYVKYRNALKIVNRLKPSAAKARHSSRIMGQMNRLRGAYVTCN